MLCVCVCVCVPFFVQILHMVLESRAEVKKSARLVLKTLNFIDKDGDGVVTCAECVLSLAVAATPSPVCLTSLCRWRAGSVGVPLVIARSWQRCTGFSSPSARLTCAGRPTSTARATSGDGIVASAIVARVATAVTRLKKGPAGRPTRHTLHLATRQRQPRRWARPPTQPPRVARG